VLLESAAKNSAERLFFRFRNDRYFIDKTRNSHIFQIEGRRPSTIYPGNYEDFLWQKKSGASLRTASASGFRPGQGTPTV